MTVLVTGGSGFVGLNVVERLLRQGVETISFGLAPPPESALRCFAGLPGTLHIAEGDVSAPGEVARLFQRHAVGRVIHGAAISSRGERDRADARGVVQTNVLGTLEVLEAARRHAVGRIVHVSSASVYGNAAFDSEILHEDATVPAPESLYAITKHAGERVSLCYKSLWDLDLIVARVGLAFGRWEYDSGVRDTLSPPLQALRLAARGEPAVLPREGPKDWVYAADVGAALQALLHLKAPRHEVYNVSSGMPWSMQDWCTRLQAGFPAFAWRIARDAGAANVDYHGDRDRAPLAIERLVEDTGFRPRFGPADAATDYLEWIGQHGFWEG